MEGAIPAAVLGLLVSAVLTPVAGLLARRLGAVDLPGPRRSHDRIVPRGAGVALVLGIACGALVLPVPDDELLPLVAPILVAAALGLAEDLWRLRVGLRLLGQCLIAVVAVAWIGPVTEISIAGHPLQAGWAWTPMAVIAVIWMMNLFNFMDGSDGLASLQAAWSAALFGLAFGAAEHHGPAAFAWLLAAASTGFLLWNRPPASVFLGDSGSLGLGTALAVLATLGSVTGSISVWTAFVIVSPFVVDATLTLARRVVAGERWYTPHRDHAYQRLLREGWSHGAVLGGLGAVNALVVTPAAMFVMIRPDADFAVALVVACVLAGIWFLVRTRGETESRSQ